MKVYILILIFFISFTHVSPFRIKRNSKYPGKEEMLSSNRYDYYLEKVSQLAGISCDLCLRAVYGVNYDFIQLKNNVVEMIRLDCEALFENRSEDINSCIRFMTEKVEKYSNKVERILDSRRVCTILRVCNAQDDVDEKNSHEKTNML